MHLFAKAQDSFETDCIFQAEQKYRQEQYCLFHLSGSLISATIICSMCQHKLDSLVINEFTTNDVLLSSLTLIGQARRNERLLIIKYFSGGYVAGNVGVGSVVVLNFSCRTCLMEEIISSLRVINCYRVCLIEDI